MTRIAYCLLVHKNPRQLCRLVRSIFSASDFFYVNIFGNSSTKESWIRELKEFESDNFFAIFRYERSWGQFQVVDATLDSMKRLARFDYNYFINLSGQCYPLKPIDSVKRFLDGKSYAYMATFKMPYPSLGLGRIRYSYYRNPFFSLCDIFLDKTFGKWKYETRRFVRHGYFLRFPRINKQLPYNLEPYGGSAYFCLPKKHVDYILEFLREKPSVLDFFKRAFAPDELFFQTIIMNSQLKDTVTNDNLRYIDWSKQGVPLPAVLTIEDKEKLLDSPKLFARKFDIEVDAQILDSIDESKIK